MKLNVLSLLNTSLVMQALASENSAPEQSANAQQGHSSTPAPDHKPAPGTTQGIWTKGPRSSTNKTVLTASSLFSLKGSDDSYSTQCRMEDAPLLPAENGRFFPRFSAHDNACNALMQQLESELQPEEKHRVATTVAESRLVHKNTIPGLRKTLANFPVAQDSLIDKDNLTFHPAVCTTLITDTPLVTSFNWQEQLFYGTLLNPDRMTPVMTGHRNLWSDDCAYDVEKWTDRTPDQAGRKPEWNGRPIANAAPSGELCHDMDVATHMAARDIALKEGGHDSLREKEILTFNEVNVVKKDNSSEPLSHGIFVDLVSNDFVYLMRKPKYEHLLRLSQSVSLDRWMMVIQTINFEFLQRRPAEFADARALCKEQNLPFFIRSMDKHGVIGFKKVDIEAADSFDKLAQANPILKSHSDALLTPLVKMLKALAT